MKRLNGLIRVAGVLLVVTIFMLASGIRIEPSANTDLDSCVARGVQYFTGLGAYPRMPDGRITWTTVRKRCILTANRAF